MARFGETLLRKIRQTFKVHIALPGDFFRQFRLHFRSRKPGEAR
jgi:hypothetical protein